jgi:hypothetical protein
MAADGGHSLGLRVQLQRTPPNSQLQQSLPHVGIWPETAVCVFLVGVEIDRYAMDRSRDLAFAIIYE